MKNDDRSDNYLFINLSSTDTDKLIKILKDRCSNLIIDSISSNKNDIRPILSVVIACVIGIICVQLDVGLKRYSENFRVYLDIFVLAMFFYVSAKPKVLRGISEISNCRKVIYYILTFIIGLTLFGLIGIVLELLARLGFIDSSRYFLDLFVAIYFFNLIEKQVEKVFNK